MFHARMRRLKLLARWKRVGKIARYMNHPDRSVYIAAIQALGECGGEEAFQVLAAQLKSSDPQIRAEAANALGIGKGSTQEADSGHWRDPSNGDLPRKRHAHSR